VRGAGYDFAPGTKASYSNSNFLLLGAIIEQVTGRDYFEAVDERIQRPAGLHETGFFDGRDGSPPLADRLVRNPAKDGWQLASRPLRGSPAGGGYSTCADILRFGRALQRGAFVPAASLRRMTADANTGIADGFPYGHGFIPERHGRLTSYGHGGIARGVNFEFRYFPGLDITLVVFSNQDNGAYDDLRRNLTKLITGER